jgi:hypothetical protein
MMIVSHSSRKVLPTFEWIVAGGVDCMLADEGDCALTDGAEGGAPDDLAVGGMLALGA